MKFHLTVFISKIAMILAKLLFNGGTNFPGKIALKLHNNILKKLAQNYNVLVITGTNGKTTTTSMVYNIIKNYDTDVITNSTGANMLSGIVSCFIQNYSIFNNKKNRYAVIEVDEANLKFVTEYISPSIIAITNLFRDQMDRYGEVYTTLEKLLEGIRKSPESTLILNGDESLLGNLDVINKKIYFGFKCPIDNNKEITLNSDAKFCKICNHPYKYKYVTYNHLGNFYCSKCGYKRPTLNYSVSKINGFTSHGSSIEIDNYPFTINQSGTYNVYNSLCAYSITKYLNFPIETITYTLENLSSTFGRQEIVDINGKNLKIILVKNPAGFDEALKSVNLDSTNKSLALLLNDNYADGTDVSWIWDVCFEDLNHKRIDDVLVSGIRLYDMGIRLKVAGLNEDSFNICDNYDKLLKSIQTNKNNNIYMLATYTAMISFRKFLNSKGYIKKLW
ncbi:Mur ligase family protein [Clostridium sediminicola]